MSRIQLYVKDTTGETYLLQLKDDSPVKMNLSVAELNPFTPSSYFSQTFRVPGQGSNAKFFKDVYSVNGSTFNPAQAAQSWILTDGFLFSVGNLNLNAVYVNEEYSTIEYEVFFLGDTSDFGSSLGELGMDTINATELNHPLTYANVTTSWGATAGATAGLKDGNVLYPLCEWGYTYGASGPDQNFPEQSSVSVNFSRSFTRGITGGLELNQLKPAVRVKWLWDQIFSEAGFTYNSEFLNSDLFDSLYFVSDSIARARVPIPAGLVKATGRQIQVFTGQTVTVPYANIVSGNESNAFDVGDHTWTCPVTGTYTIKVTSSGYFGKNAQGATASGYPQAAWIVRILSNGTQINSSTVSTTNDPNVFTWPYKSITINTLTTTFQQGDEVYVQLNQLSYGNSQAFFGDNTFEVTNGPNEVVVSSFFPPADTMKRIDFMKSITRMFNLVFEPSRDVQKSFTIEPWVNWIQTGTERNWSDLFDGSLDTTSSAVFLDQQRVLVFTTEEDADYQNQTYQDQYKRDYGYLQYDSGIKLIKGQQDIKVDFASTPLQSIPANNLSYPDWVVPTLARIQPGDPTEQKAGKVEPIQPVPRILFYNGLQPNPQPWYLNVLAGTGGTASAQNSYPLVSPYSSWPPDEFTTLNLTFQNKTPLWSPQSSYNGLPNDTLYSEYWEEYVDWLYDPYNRKVKATLRLDPYDINTVRFNDKIWIKDTWYFINKISNYPVGDVAKVELELIKLPPAAIPGPIPLAATGATGDNCVSVSFCNNNVYGSPLSTYIYVDCNGNLQSLSLEPQTCATLCSPYPNPRALPDGWSQIQNGECVDQVFVAQGQDVQVQLETAVAATGTFTTIALEASTGGTAGTYIPFQYITGEDDSSFSVLSNVPNGYGLKATLKKQGGVTGASIVEQDLLLKVNGATVANVVQVGTYAAITAQFPAGITGSTTYSIRGDFAY